MADQTHQTHPGMNDPRKGLPSASGAESYSLCAGKFVAERGLSELENEWAESGTDTHEDSTEEVPKTETAERAREIETRVVAGLVPVPVLRMYREKRLWGHDPDTMATVCSGQMDAFWLGEQVAVISDLKSLYGKVPTAPENLQLRWQAALVWEEYGIHEVLCFINQPMVTSNPTVVRYGEEELRRAHAEMIALAKRVMQPGLPRTSGASQCKFCRAKIECKEYNEWTGLLKPIALRDLPIAGWTPTHWETFLSLEMEVRNWIESTKEKAKAMLSADPLSLPGWELKPGRINRPITNAYEVYVRGTRIGVLNSEFMEAVKITKGTWEKAVKRVTRLKGAALESKINEMLDGCTDERQGEPTLVRKSKTEAPFMPS